MKYTLVLIFGLLLTHPAVGQRVLIVDNTGLEAEGEHVYTDLQTAINESQSGDIIHVMPSIVNYGNIEIIEKTNLSIIGNGLESQRSIGLQSFNSSFNTLDIRGSSNILLRGLDLGSTDFGTTNSSRSTNISFDHVILSLIATNADNVIVTNSIVTGLTNSNISNIGGTGVVITNSILSNSYSSNGNRIDGLTFINNLFYAFGWGFDNFVSTNCLFKNNLFVFSRNIGRLGNRNHTFINNFSNNSTTPWETGTNTAENNIALDISLSEIFADASIDENDDGWDLEWSIEVIDSQILNGGDDGTDIGPTGGSDPLIYPAYSLPTIYNLIAPTKVQAGEDLEITIKARGN